MSHGKITAQILDAIKHAIANPGAQVVYLCPSKEEIRRFVWRRLLDMLASEDTQADLTHHKITFPNGSCIRLMRQDEDRRAHGLMFDKILGDGWGPFWKTRLRP